MQNKKISHCLGILPQWSLYMSALLLQIRKCTQEALSRARGSSQTDGWVKGPICELATCRHECRPIKAHLMWIEFCIFYFLFFVQPADMNVGPKTPTSCRLSFELFIFYKNVFDLNEACNDQFNLVTAQSNEEKKIQSIMRLVTAQLNLVTTQILNKNIFGTLWLNKTIWAFNFLF